MYKKLHSKHTDLGVAIITGMVPGSVIVGKLDMMIVAEAIYVAQHGVECRPTPAGIAATALGVKIAQDLAAEEWTKKISCKARCTGIGECCTGGGELIKVSPSYFRDCWPGTHCSEDPA